MMDVCTNLMMWKCSKKMRLPLLLSCTCHCLIGQRRLFSGGNGKRLALDRNSLSIGNCRSTVAILSQSSTHLAISTSSAALVFVANQWFDWQGEIDDVYPRSTLLQNHEYCVNSIRYLASSARWSWYSFLNSNQNCHYLDELKSPKSFWEHNMKRDSRSLRTMPTDEFEHLLYPCKEM